MSTFMNPALFPSHSFACPLYPFLSLPFPSLPSPPLPINPARALGSGDVSSLMQRVGPGEARLTNVFRAFPRWNYMRFSRLNIDTFYSLLDRLF